MDGSTRRHGPVRDSRLHANRRTASGAIRAGAGGLGFPLPFLGKMYLAPGCKYNGSPLYLSEFGGVAYVPEGERDVPEDSWGYAGIEPDRNGGRQSEFEGCTRPIAKLPRISGVCYTQLCDVEQEINGLLTYDRRPKFDVRRDPARSTTCWQSSPRQMKIGRASGSTLFHFNEVQSAAAAALSSDSDQCAFRRTTGIRRTSTRAETRPRGYSVSGR